MVMLWLAALAAFAIGVIIYLADTGNLGFAYAVYDFPHGDKVGHVVLLGLVTFPAVAGMLRLSRGNPVKVAVRTAAAIAALITAEELSQAFLPSRSVDALDLMASYVGIAGAAWAAYRLHLHTNGHRAERGPANVRT